ncbi:MAG: UDP-N-acetylglucosamine 1-carboxyvinyltransferase [Parvularculales bacterium]
MTGALSDCIRITGGSPLHGIIPISGAKNAALPLMIASLLTEGTVELDNVPDLTDTTTLTRLLENHGVKIESSVASQSGRRVRLKADSITSLKAPYDLVSQMRASFWVLGPLLARCGKARISLPGGDAIGNRPVDLYIKGLETMGAKITTSGGYVEAVAPHGLKGAVFRSPLVSVGVTHTLMMAATLAEGETVLENAAREPEVVDLAHCLIAMGAQIEGVGEDRLVIRGGRTLTGVHHQVPPDRIEAGTYAMAALVTGGEVELQGVETGALEAPIALLRSAGGVIEETTNGLNVRSPDTSLQGVNVQTAPWPGFPTDLQAQFMALMTCASGISEITETIFENRFMHVQELIRLGADISLQGETARVRGVEYLTGAPVVATDLRASVCLVIAGLAAKGETIINEVYHLDRGFERLEEKLGRCGASIERKQN